MYVSEVIKIAEAEIGYKEKATNANLDSKTANAGSNNWTKYGRDLGKAGYYNGSKNGYAWCDQFVDWVFYMAAGENKAVAEDIQCQTGIYGAGCGYSARYYEQQNRLDKNPKKGDQVFFRYKGTTSGADHTGLVVDVTDTKITTIEGNAGNCVQKRTYDRNDATLYAFGHPKYEAEPVKPTTYNITMPRLELGSQGAEVKTIQRLLRMRGYKGTNGENLTIDGDFGANTLYALQAFQKKKLGKAYTYVGKNTWTKLMKE